MGNNSNNIFLIGLMGAGKTTIGRALARKLHLQFIDSDHEIQKKTGVSVRTIFELEGEAGFRARESAMIADLTLREGIVLATGGGAVLMEETRKFLHERGTVIYLRARPEDLYKRTKHDRDRPLLQTDDPLAKLRALLKERGFYYEGIAHIVIDTADQGVPRLIANIEQELLAFQTTTHN
jgi:shikimate kinase